MESLPRVGGIRDAACVVDPIQVQGALQQDPDGTWQFIRVPPEVRSALGAGARRGGTIPVVARIVDREWPTSLLPWADGAAQLNIPATHRRALGVHPGDVLTVEVSPRV